MGEAATKYRVVIALLLLCAIENVVGKYAVGEYSTLVALVPYGDIIEPEVDETLRKLTTKGIAVWRRQGQHIDRLRSAMAWAAIDAGFEELLWIDADTQFEVDAVDLLREWDLPLVGCVIAKKGQQRLASQFMVEQTQIQLGEKGGLLEVRHTGTGIMYTRAEVYRNIQKVLGLPTCVGKGSFSTVVPWFEPIIVTTIPGLEGKHMYLSEDFAFV